MIKGSLLFSGEKKLSSVFSAKNLTVFGDK